MKQIYDCEFTFHIEYEKEFFFVKGKGFFQTKTLKDICRWDVGTPLFIENEEEAKKIFKKFAYWTENIVKAWSWSSLEYRIDRYVVTDKSLQIYQKFHTLEDLKNRMDSYMFLEYCRQELIDPKAVIE